MKDTIIQSSPGIGNQVEMSKHILSFMKVCAILPIVLIFMSILTKLTHRYSVQQIFKYLLAFFSSFFLIYCYILEPNIDLIQNNSFAISVMKKYTFLPSGCRWVLYIIQNWTASLFYCFAELWGVVVIAVCFWGFANEITDINQAKRIYPLFCLGANSSGIFSGMTAQFLKNRIGDMGSPDEIWSKYLTMATLVFLTLNVVTYLLFTYIEKKVLNDPNQIPKSFEETKAYKKNKKTKYSITQSLSRVTNSKYLLSVACIVFSFAFINNVVELIWKSKGCNVLYRQDRVECLL